VHYDLLLMRPSHIGRATAAAVVLSEQRLLQATRSCGASKLFSTHSLGSRAVAVAAPTVAVYLGPLVFCAARCSLLTFGE
jgi:hypothetical protein